MIKNLGYFQSQADNTLFVKYSEDKKITILIVYVDDIIVTGDNFEEIKRIKQMMEKEFEVKELGALNSLEWKLQEAMKVFLCLKENIL